jgi:hypothetical protein
LISTSGFLESSVDWRDEYILKMASRSVNSIRSYVLLFVGIVIMGNPYTCPKFRGFWGIWPPKIFFSSTWPQKGSSLGRNASFKPSTIIFRQSVRPVQVSKKIIGKERKGKGRKGKERKGKLT